MKLNMHDYGVYGLRVMYRLYKCDCCGHERHVQTNHTMPCLSYCKCSWTFGRDSNGKFYRADTQKQRPCYYVGDNPDGEGEENMHISWVRVREQYTRDELRQRIRN